jgi:excisionase family DNA binding protein
MAKVAADAPTDDLVTYAEAADILQVSVRTVHRLREDGALAPIVSYTVRGGSIVRFRRSQVVELAAAGSGAGA